MSRRPGRSTRSRSNKDASAIDADMNLVKMEPADIGHDTEDKGSQADMDEPEDVKPLRRGCSTRSKSAKATRDSRSQSEEMDNKDNVLTQNLNELSTTRLLDEIEIKPPTEEAEETEKPHDTLSTIDAANIGIDSLLTKTEPSEPEPPVVTKKRRGRKPKVKKTEDVPESNDASTTESKTRFPQSIVNGIISIDMSNINVKQEASENQANPEPSEKLDDATSTEKTEKKKRRKSAKKQDENGEVKTVKARRNVAKKRGRPSAPKDGEVSSAPSSPVKPPIKRGRKIKPNATTRNTTTSKDGNGSYYPYEGLANISEIEQDEVLMPGDLEGYENVETFSEKLYLACQNKMKEDEDHILKLLPARALNRGILRDVLQMPYVSSASRLLNPTNE